MISAERAIRAARRDGVISSLLGWAYPVAVVVVVFAAPPVGGLMVVLAGVAIGASVMAGVRGSRWTSLIMRSPSLIGAGQYDEAEEQIEQVMGTFWSMRSAKLLGLHHLAMLRHAQRRWGESAMLSGALLRLSRPGLLSGGLIGRRLLRPTGRLPAGVARAAQLMLADSLVELGDLTGAHQALAALYAQKLTLNEAMSLLVVQLEYEARAGAWASMLANIGHKVQLAELLPAGPAARSQALLALAAQRSGRPDLAAWLRRRAELLADVTELVAQRPALAEVFGGATQEASPVDGGAERGDTEVGA